MRKLISSLLGAALLPCAAFADPPLKPAAPTQAPLPTAPLVVRALPAALIVAEPDDPTLEQAQRAAERIAAGDPSEDSSRMSRARAAHFAPVVRGQFGQASNDQTRDGVAYAEPVHYTNLGETTTWVVTLTWDLPSAIYARDENQLALSQVHLARVRREVSLRCAQLYAQRKHKLLDLRAHAGLDAATQLEGALALLEITAELDGLTGGLFTPQLARAQARATALSRSLHLEETP